MADNHAFYKEEIENILNNATNKTLGEVDKNHVFDRTKTNPKITGIAGDVIEQSVIGYTNNHERLPDLNIDGVFVELKTTGIREGKKSGEIEAKEPVSITAVSINTIAEEDFKHSAFWHKTEHMLFVYYHYSSLKTVKAADYADFRILGFKFYDFKDETRAVLENDWQIVHDYIQNIQKNYTAEDAEKYYPDLSSKINSQLVYLDTAPKYPHAPRFRFRRRFVTMLVQEKFGKKLEREILSDTYYGYSEVYKKCHEITSNHFDKTFEELCDFYKINIEGKTNEEIKSYTEKIVIKMFGGEASKISKIGLFVKFGLIGKTVALTSSEGRTEDMKLTSANFEEIEEKPFFKAAENEDEDNIESELYSYLHDHKLLCIVFMEQSHNSKEPADLKKNKFKGFKVLDLDSPDIVKSAENTWNSIQELLRTNGLRSEQVYTKAGKPRFNKNGLAMEATNLPKSSEGLIFLKGTGDDSSDKQDFYGVNMYKQDFWIKGLYIAEKLKRIDYL